MPTRKAGSDQTGGLPRPRCVACAFVSAAEKRARGSRPLLAVRTSGASGGLEPLAALLIKVRLRAAHIDANTYQRA